MAAGRHIENHFLGYMSTIYCPINAKFGMQTQILVLRTVTTKYQNFANSKWRTAAILKLVFWLYHNDLLSDWCKMWYEEVEWCSDTGHVTKIPNFINSRCRTDAIFKMVLWSRDKVSKFANSKWRPAAIFKVVYGYISTIYCAINAKFGMRIEEAWSSLTQFAWSNTKFRKF